MGNYIDRLLQVPQTAETFVLNFFDWRTMLVKLWNTALQDLLPLLSDYGRKKSLSSRSFVFDC